MHSATHRPRSVYYSLGIFGHVMSLYICDNTLLHFPNSSKLNVGNSTGYLIVGLGWYHAQIGESDLSYC